MSDHPIWRGSLFLENIGRGLRRTFAELATRHEGGKVALLSDTVAKKVTARGLHTAAGQKLLARRVAGEAIASFLEDDTAKAAIKSLLPLFHPLAACLLDLIEYEGPFVVPVPTDAPSRSALWEQEDALLGVSKRLDQLDKVEEELVAFVRHLIEPLVTGCPALLQNVGGDGDISFETPLLDNLPELPAVVEHVLLLPFAPDLEEFGLTKRLKDRLEYNLTIASGGTPGDGSKSVRLPSKASGMAGRQLVASYLGGTPLTSLLDARVPIVIPTTTRFEHHHIVAGSGHGKTQTLQHLILHDLEAVAAGRASIIVIDSQSDLINNIAGMAVFAPGGALHDRLVLIDPTDVEYPVALNLFDMGQRRLDRYSALDRERLLNGILELYDFVLGSLLDAGMTQKQTVIFRYITRLLIHIPGATIHTLRELLEDDGYERYEAHIAKLEGSAKAFFQNEFRGKQFTETRRQVLRRLYGILENQTFERMFSHPKSRLDLFTEMNAGKVILINTAKDLLKENGTEIFGRFFIAMIAQAAQERATLSPHQRLPTFVYVDEASDYFDRNIGIILSQARKNRVGMVLAHQYLGQLEPKLLEAISANTAIKFAGGVSAKDARALAGDMRADPDLIEGQDKLSFAAFIKGTTKNAVSISVPAGRMEREPRMGEEARDRLRDLMRSKYAVLYTETRPGPGGPEKKGSEEGSVTQRASHVVVADDGKPTRWET